MFIITIFISLSENKKEISSKDPEIFISKFYELAYKKENYCFNLSTGFENLEKNKVIIIYQNIIAIVHKI